MHDACPAYAYAYVCPDVSLEIDMCIRSGCVRYSCMYMHINRRLGKITMYFIAVKPRCRRYLR